MDSRLIPYVLAAGWLLVTLGVWGATGRPWWIWPLSVGAGLLVIGGVYGWAAWGQIEAEAVKKIPEDVRT